MKIKWLDNMSKKVSKTAQKKAKELYDAASPKVQKEIDKIIATKTEDLAKNALKIGGIAMMIIFVIKGINSSESVEETAETLGRVINIHYDEVNITYNYYSKED